MSDEPIKFRCYRCGKLLGASSRRVGAVVSCPRCRAEIQVPEPVAAEDEPSGSVAATEEVAFPAIVDSPAGDAVVPPIRLDAPSVAIVPTPVRAPDVVLPPGVVMAWSLLVLLAIPLAFTAGLLIGHYVWK